MFCSKCGTQIADNDKVCPKCGAINENYVEPKTKKISIPKIEIQRDGSNSSEGTKGKGKKIAIVAGIAIIAIGAVIGIGGKFGNGSIGVPDKVAYTEGGLSAYVDDQNSYFLVGQDVKKFDGSATSGSSTPDKSKYIVLKEDKNLSLFEDASTEGIVVSTDASEIGRVINKGFFYKTGSKAHIFYYDFSSKESTDTGLENVSLRYSANGNTFVAINEKGEMFSFSTKDKAVTTLCNAGTDANICCVADDGSNVIWSTKSGNAYSIYMMKNGAPERIGKITNSEKYSSCYGYFFNNDKSFLIYSSNSSQMVISKNGEISEITLPGVKTYDSLVNRDGLWIDSDDDNIDIFYIAVAKNKDSSNGQLYKMTSSGELTIEADDINLDAEYCIRNGLLFYTNKDNDLMRKKLGEETVDSITTDVTRFMVSPSGKYVYLVKSGGLYYWEASDKTYKLSLITSSFTSDDEMYLTNKDDTIFYISDMKDISDSYRTHGTAYRYIVGSAPEKITEKVLDITKADTQYVMADGPILRKYVSNVKYDYVVDYGTVVEGAYQALITNINY